MAFVSLCALVSLTFADLFSVSQVPSRRDLLLFFLPFKTLLADALRAGDLPLWNPWTFLGTPFLASLQTGVLYPPSVLLLLPFPLGFNVFLLFHYFVALGGAWAFFRFRDLGLAASALGSLTFVLGGYLVSLLNVTNHLQSAAWIPLALCLWTRRLEAPSTRADGGLVAVMTLVVLGGSAEALLMTLVLLFAWGLFRGLPDARGAARSALSLAVISCLAAGLAAFQLLPTAELTRHSVRGAAFGFGQTSFWSLEPVSLLQLLFPHSSSLMTAAEQNSIGQVLESQVPWLSSLYLGLVPLCLAIAGLARGRERAFWGILATLGVLLALGKHGPLLPHLYELAPGLFGKFRYPEKFWLFVHVAAAVLCAEGAERALRGDRQARRLACVAAATFVVVGLFVLGLRWTRPLDLLQILAAIRGADLPPIAFAELGTDIVFKAQRLVVILGAFLAILELERRRLLRPALAGTMVVGLVAADLGGAHYNLNLSISWSELMRHGPLVDVDDLRERGLRAFYYQTVSSPRWGSGGEEIAGLEEGFRVLRNTDDVREFALSEWPALPANTGIFHGVGTVVGGEAIDRAEIEMLRDVLAVLPRERAVHLLRVYAVGALIGSSPLDVPSLRFVGKSDRLFAYEMRDPLPRAYLATRLRPAEGLLAAFNGVVAADFEPGRDAVVERLPEGWDGSADGETRAAVTVVRYGADRVVLRSEARTSALLVLTDSWFPGWEARVDGEEAEIVRTNALVRGVMVPAGEHEVVFAYRPLSFRLGAGISLVTGIISLAWIVLRSRRRAGRPPR